MVSWGVVTAPRGILGTVAVGGQAPVAILGALNLSPESFYAGSVHRGVDDLVRAALDMVEAGATMIDVGARSTAPYGMTTLDEAEEMARLLPAVGALARKLPVPISIDTTRVAVAARGLDAGASILNDVGGLTDPAMAALGGARGVSVIAVASPGVSGGSPRGAAGPAAAIEALLAGILVRGRAAGIREERLVLDPGIGFFRDEGVPWDVWDVATLAGLPALVAVGRPLCVGVSRKSFLGAITGRRDPGQRLAASLAAAAIAVFNGAAVIRTHDVAETVDAVRVAERLRGPLPSFGCLGLQSTAGDVHVTVDDPGKQTR